MENNENNTEQAVVVVKQENIETTLPDLGFVDDKDGLMVLDTDNGAIGVDKETGVVAIQTNGATVEELAIVSEMVANGVAETISADQIQVDGVKNELENESNTKNNEE